MTQLEAILYQTQSVSLFPRSFTFVLVLFF